MLLLPLLLSMLAIMDIGLMVSRLVLQNNLSAGMIVAGWDKHEGGSVYTLPLGGSLIKVPFSIGGPTSNMRHNPFALANGH